MTLIFKSSFNYFYFKDYTHGIQYISAVMVYVHEYILHCVPFNIAWWLNMDRSCSVLKMKVISHFEL